jgi:hypothetical protein
MVVLPVPGNVISHNGSWYLDMLIAVLRLDMLTVAVPAGTLTC